MTGGGRFERLCPVHQSAAATKDAAPVQDFDTARLPLGFD